MVTGLSARGDAAQQPDDESGWREYHRWMFDATRVTTASGQWKIGSTGVNMARTLRRTRNRARAAWVAEHGEDVGAWPLPHPPTVLWSPDMAKAACLGCDWLGRTSPDRDEAAEDARRHAIECLEFGAPRPRLLDEPLRVWRRDAPFDAPGPKWAGRLEER